MKLVCPSCGATASADIWSNDAVAREAVMAIAALPAPLHISTMHYFTLFRPVKSALAWKKVLRLAGEIKALCGAGYVSTQGQVDRNCPPRIWAAAMDEMAERQNAIKRPLKSHNYLRQVAWGLADQAAKQQESGTRNQEATHTRPEATHGRPVSFATIDPLAAIKENWDADK